MSLNDQIAMEERMKLEVPTPILKKRKSYCDECKNKGANNFCQINSQWLPEFLKYRYNACPAGIWVDGWQ